MLFRSDIVDLANKTNGGDGVSGLKMSKESRAKMSEKAKGRPGVKSMLGRKHTAETRAKMSAAKKDKKPNNYGKKFSDKTREKMSLRMKKFWENKRRQKLEYIHGDES